MPILTFSVEPGGRKKARKATNVINKHGNTILKIKNNGRRLIVNL